jgi:endonuclease/exonuclease/phosphatase family metal-dependent hydrolase
MKIAYPIILIAAGCMITLACACGSETKKENIEDGPYKWDKETEVKPVEIDTDKTYFPKADGAFRIMSYNVGALHKYISVLTDNVNMIAAMINEAQADVVGLNELDSCNARCNQYQLKLLAQASGKWDYYYGKTLDYRGGAYGNGVMTPAGTKVHNVYRLHFQNTTNYENRGMIIIETDKYVLGVTHLDHSSEDYIQSQISEINSWFQAKYRNADIPVFFCGDMNAKPGSEAIQAIESSWDIISNTKELTTERNTIDYVFHYKKSAPVEVLGAHTLNRFYNGDAKTASDHLPIYVDVKLK